MTGNELVRDRAWQWRRGLSDAATFGLLAFGVAGAIPGLPKHGDWLRWLPPVTAALVVAVGCVVAWLRTGVSLDGAWVTVRNPVRTRRIAVEELVAVTSKKAYGRQRYLALVRQRVDTRNFVIPLAALPSTAARDPEIVSRLPFLAPLVEQSHIGAISSG